MNGTLLEHREVATYEDLLHQARGVTEYEESVAVLEDVTSAESVGLITCAMSQYIANILSQI